MTPATLAEMFAAALLGAACVAGLSLRHIQKLRHQLKDKEDSIARTSKLLIEKNIELFDQNVHQQKLLAAKDDFLAIASHQLRTPANEIKWQIGGILQAGYWDPRARSDLEKIQKSAAKMERLIEDLLDFVTVEQGGTRRAVSPYDPDTIVRQVAQRTAKNFSHRAIALSFSLEFRGTLESLDPDALDMAMDNLLENAYLYTPHTTGTVRVATMRGKGGEFQAEVEDSGIGVDPGMREHLFVKFRRGTEAQKRNTEGSGLGLYVVKTIVERVGGTVQFAPRDGGGSIFRISIPSKKAG